MGSDDVTRDWALDVCLNLFGFGIRAKHQIGIILNPLAQGWNLYDGVNTKRRRHSASLSSAREISQLLA